MSSTHALPEKLSDAQLAALKTASNLSEEEIQAQYAGFIRDFPSGKLTRDQYREFSKKIDDSVMDAQTLESLFEVFDKNKDGTIDFNEYLLGMVAKSGGSEEAKLVVAFNMLDKSGDGYISFQEIVDFFTVQLLANSKGSEEDVSLTDFIAKVASEKLFNQLGIQDQSQKISKEQFMAAAKNLPELF